MNFLGGTADKNPPANAEDTGSISGPGIFHMLQTNKVQAPQLLNPCSRAHEPQLLRPHWCKCMCLEPVLCNERHPHTEQPVLHSEDSPCSLQLEKARVRQRRPGQCKPPIKYML